jgi:hypothetical protein
LRNTVCRKSSKGLAVVRYIHISQVFCSIALEIFSLSTIVASVVIGISKSYRNSHFFFKVVFWISGFGVWNSHDISYGLM